MLEYKNHRYSRESFPEYRFRAIVEFEITEVEDHQVKRKLVKADIYTTNSATDVLKNVLFKHSADKVTDIKIIHWASKEQDDAASALIEEWLKEDKI